MVCRLRSLVYQQRCLRGRLHFASSTSVCLFQAVLPFLLTIFIGSLFAHYRCFRRLFVYRMAVLMGRRDYFSSYFLLALMSSCNGPRVSPRLSLGRHIFRLDHYGLSLRNFLSWGWQSRRLLRFGIFIDFGQPFCRSLFHEPLKVGVKFTTLLHQFSHGVTQHCVELHFPKRLISLKRFYFVFEVVGINY